MTAIYMKVKRLQRGQAISLLAAIVLVLGLMSVVSPILASTCDISVSPGGSIQTAINGATSGQTICVADGTYVGALSINKDNLTIEGQSQAGVIIDATAATGYHFTVEGSNIVLRNFTLNGKNTSPASYGIKASGLNASTQRTNLTIENVTVNNTYRSGIDINGIDGVTVNNVTVSGVPYGVGLALSDVNNATVSNVTTSNNTWGGVAVYTYGRYYPGGSDNITLSNIVGDEANPLYTEVGNYSVPSNPHPITNLTLPTEYTHSTRNPQHRPGGENFVFFFTSEADAVTFALALNNATTPVNSGSSANVMNSTSHDDFGDFVVGNNGTDHMSIQAAINAATNGDTIYVAAGTYAENVAVSKSVTLTGANVGVNPNTGSRIGESILNGSVMVSSNDVTFDGFTVSNPSGTSGISVTSVSGANVRNSIFNDIGTGNATGSAQAVYISTSNSPISNFTISNNKIMNVGNISMLHNGNAGSSAKGIYVGNSGGTGDISNVNITGNNISAIYASTAAWVSGGGGGAGAYGVLINHISSNAKIVNNTISQLEALWAHGIGLEASTPNAVVQGNDISNLTDHKSPSDAIAVFFEGNTSASTASVQFNTFNSVAVGVAAVNSSTPIKATNNFWGANSGPSGGFTTPAGCAKTATSNGSGSIAGPNVCFSPFVGSAPQEVTSGAVSGSGTVDLPGNEVQTSFSGGSATVTLAKYTGNPSTVGTFGNVGNYYDINVSGSTSGDSLAITLDAGGNTGSLYYYDGTSWKLVQAPGAIAPSGGFYTFVLDNMTTPKLSELDGTPFGGLSPVVWVELAPGFNSATFGEGETIDVVVKAGSSALYGVDLSLKYGAGLDVTRVTLGGTSTGANLYADAVSHNSSGSGDIRFAYSQRGDVVGHEDNVNDSSITLATITFLAKNGGTGVQNVYLDGTVSPLLFSDKDGNNGTPVTPIVVGDNPLALTVIASPDVYVSVSLQGRSDFAGTYLKLSPLSGQSGNVLYDNQDTAGLLQIDPVPANSNPPSAKTYDVRLDAPKYLAAIRQVPVTPGTDDSIDLTSVQLRGGDLNDDDKINIQDLVLIGVNFGSNDSNNLANINGDAGVNIQDLAIAAGNFGAITGSAYSAPWQ